MAVYDFETVVPRFGTGSFKWESMRQLKQDLSLGAVPLSVADMEFATPPEIAEGLKSFIDKMPLGYSGIFEEYKEQVVSWIQRRHAFRPEKEWIVETDGVVPAIRQMVRAFTEKGDSVLIMTPVYYPFRSSVTASGRNLVESRLLEEDGVYSIDFDDLAVKAARRDVKLMILCSPHNPVGRVWKREELLKVSRICLENGVFLISDEIHFDIVMPGFEHFSLLRLDGEELLNTAICTAPSKSFNLAGLQCANIFIPDEAKRQALRKERDNNSLNILAYQACILAYKYCEPWLEQMISVVDRNRRLVEETILVSAPQIKLSPLEGTYLQWLDLRCLGLDVKAQEKLMIDHELFFDEGYIFGDGGEGFERINLAVPTEVVRAAIDRLIKAVNEIQSR